MIGRRNFFWLNNVHYNIRNIFTRRKYFIIWQMHVDKTWKHD